jgi:transposase
MTQQKRQAEIERLKSENAAVLNVPMISEGNISSTQINRMGKKQFQKWQDDVSRCFEIRSQIRQLSKSDEEIAKEERELEAKRKQELRLSHERYIATIEGLGLMTHRKNGKLKPSYQVAVDAAREEIAKLL